MSAHSRPLLTDRGRRPAAAIWLGLALVFSVACRAPSDEAAPRARAADGSRFGADGAPAVTPASATSAAVAPGAAGARARRAGCPSFGPPRSLGVIESAEISEASGLVASRRTPGLWWVHNDSGAGPTLFAVASNGRTLATFTVAGARAVDWEDIALAPDPAHPERDLLYVADTGDNLRERPSITLYTLPEPVIASAAASRKRRATTEPARALELDYPDGPRDAEALLVDPRGSVAYLVTKALLGGSEIYRVERPANGERSRLVAEGSVALGDLVVPGSRLVTAGDYSSDGAWVVLRTYTALHLFRREGDELLHATLARAPCPVPVLPEPQGEAVGFAADCRALVTLSEGAHQPMVAVPWLGAE